MPFNSIIFVGFLAGVTAVYYLVPRLAKPYFLLLASYAFYLYQPENARLVALLIGATVVTWAAGLAIGRLEQVWAKRAFLLLALFVCLGILFFYKYAGMASGGVISLTAPLGLSYFTFQSLGYVIEVYRGKASPEKNPLKYALFVSFFPCIFTGPIERKEHLIPQFNDPPAFSYSVAAGGAARVLWGYVKKMVLADNFAVFVQAVYQTAAGVSGPYVLAASLLFSLQIYLDFSGCCDIAIGGARMLGFELMENFDRPFSSRSYSEFWNRWHISLSGWFKDCLYIPLGGSRKGTARTCLNLMIVFMASGLWHGAGLGYLLWGAANGLVLIAAKLTADARQRIAEKNPLCRVAWLRRIWQCCCVYLLFTGCVVFFAAELYGADPLTVYGSMLGGWDTAFAGGFAAFAEGFARLGLDGTTALMLAISCLVVLLIEQRGRVSDWFRRRWFFVRWPLYYAMCLLLLFFGAFGQSVFIYQQY